MRIKAFKGTVGLVAVTAAALVCFASCTKENLSKPDGFGMQGVWMDSGQSGGIFTFGALPDLTYGYYNTVTKTVETGTYTYDPSSDALTLTHEKDGVAVVEHYTVEWQDAPNYTQFKLKLGPNGNSRYNGLVFTKSNGLA